jgi:prepilin-type processing-associated H-X9-DG protein
MRGYSESMFLIDPATSANTAVPRQWSRIKYPSTVIHVSDAYYPGGGVGMVKNLGANSNDVKLGINQRFDLYRHNRDKGANILFADGHVSYYDRNDVQKNITYDAAKPQSMHLNWRLP